MKSKRRPAPEPERSNQRERATAIERDPRWAALVARNASGPHEFYYSVETTGVYCRSTCGARLPRPENVAFYDTARAAERAGFRPCKRCEPSSLPPDTRRAELVAKLCRYIEESASPPTLKELASRSMLSVFHTQRLFKSVTGVTPRAYAAALRAERARAGLAGQGGITRAILDAGYGSTGRFYAESNARLGMTPKTLRARGSSLRIRYAVGRCSLGAVLVAATDRGVCSILLGDDPDELVRDLERRFAQAELSPAERDFETLVQEVVSHVERPEQASALPLDVRGTAFQERVWRELTRIPRGRTCTYAELAEAIGSPRAVRAVASACAANPLAVVVPCHRVVRGDGDLAGYRWGIERKQELLRRERSVKSGSKRSP